ncbi:MAG: hypothetical protein K2G51_09375, partial [Lachnospiraceae bacterium]|nr:hypothetical protein [Lachnospiraceae bacterium]
VFTVSMSRHSCHLSINKIISESDGAVTGTAVTRSVKPQVVFFKVFLKHDVLHIQWKLPKIQLGTVDK